MNPGKCKLAWVWTHVGILFYVFIEEILFICYLVCRSPSIFQLILMKNCVNSPRIPAVHNAMIPWFYNTLILPLHENPPVFLFIVSPLFFVYFWSLTFIGRGIYLKRPCLLKYVFIAKTMSKRRSQILCLANNCDKIFIIFFLVQWRHSEKMEPSQLKGTEFFDL